jgi:hypothetical protein
MKKCANCGSENPDDAIDCPVCSTDTFISSSPEAVGGHIISPEEQRFWERMTFRQFAVFFIRIQALWFIVSAVLYAVDLIPYLFPYLHFTRYALLIALRVGLNVAGAVVCIRYADRIVSWFVKDVIPRASPNESATPNGGHAAPPGNSGVSERPPSVT